MWRELESIGFKQSQVHQIVVTALAIVPEELWEHAVVLKYDAGVPDVYRLLRLGRAYFSRNRYERIIDCLQFPPYSDVLQILAREGLAVIPERPILAKSRQFYLRGTLCR